ncbi:MAG TPA: protein kinase [Candidatus Paceibacterota bacterium]
MAKHEGNFRTRFEMQRELGEGAMGTVHLAYDTFFQRNVAIKRIRSKLFDDPEHGNLHRKMWLNEIRLVGKLKHPFIVEVFEAGNSEDFEYLVMEYVEGTTLNQFTAFDKLLPLDRLIDILYKVCNALDFANKTGILHRDIKPANVLLGEHNTVKLSDFGAAFYLNSEYTQVFDVGTLAFMPPEHFRQRQPTLQSDIYSVGVMAYQLLTGALPFASSSHEGLIYEKLNDDPVPLERRRHDIPQALRFAVHRAMHRDMEVRYDSWKAFCDDLAAALPHVERPVEARFDSASFDSLRNLAFFENFTDTEVWETVGLCSWQERSPGERIVKEGDAGNSLFIIIQGDAGITKKGAELNHIGPGGCFGEMAFLDEAQHTRSATVTANTALSLIEIDGEALRQASANLQTRFFREFMKIMIERVRHADQRILTMLDLD